MNYILIIGFFGLKQKNVFLTLSDKPHVSPLQNNYTGKEDDGFIRRLTAYMDEEQPFLDPEINIAKLSRMLDVRPEYLSEVLNDKLGQNFFDFINRYRIEAFKTQCISDTNKHLSIVGIAYSCGFNSKASFYRAFKKFEGKTPIAYIQSVS